MRGQLYLSTSSGRPPEWLWDVLPGTKRWLLRLNSNRHNLLKAWIAAVLWLIVIAIESTAIASAANTGRILYPLLHFLFGMDWSHFETWHFYIRKGGHVVGYAILSILLFRAWRATLPAIENAEWSARWASIALVGTAVVASLDEWHQSFIPSRTGRWQDVVLDTCAGVAAQCLIVLWSKNFGKGSGLGKGTSSLLSSRTDKDAGFSR